MYMNAYLCVGTCTECGCQWRPEEGASSPGSGGIDDCELLDVGTTVHSSARVVCILLAAEWFLWPQDT